MSVYKLFKDGKEINRIVADSEEWVAGYCAENGYTYAQEPDPESEPAAEETPSQLDRVEAQATYTAMMTDTLLEV